MIEVLILFIGVWIFFLFPPLIFIVPIIAFLFKLLSNVIDKVIYNIIDHTDSPKHQKEKWINNLKNGKQVNIGDATIQCKNNILTINGKSFFINEIQKLEITYKILSVKKTIIDTHQSVWRSNIGYNPQIIVKDKIMTVEEYKKDIDLANATAKENKERPNRYYNSARYNEQYKFDKEYYILVRLYNGSNEIYPIAFCTACDKEVLNAPNEENLVLELNNYIDSLKK